MEYRTLSGMHSNIYSVLYQEESTSLYARADSCSAVGYDSSKKSCGGYCC